MYKTKNAAALILSFIIFFLVGCNSSVAKKERIVINQFQEGKLSTRTFEEIVVTYPRMVTLDKSDWDGWLSLEEEKDGALYFYFDHGTFSIFCREADIEVSELKPKERTILTEGYSEPQTVEYENSTWEVQTIYKETSEIGLEGFLATSFFNGRKYFIVAYMDNDYDMNDDFQAVMNHIRFKEDLSMYYDGEYNSEQEYPLVTVSDIQAGTYTDRIIAIDAVLGHYATYDLQDTQNLLDMIKGKTDEIITSHSIHFDAWFNDGSQYICVEDWDIYEKYYSKYFLAQFNNIDDGDIVRLYLKPRWSGDFGSALIWIELIEKSTLEKQGIEYPIIIETEPIETEAVQETNETSAPTEDWTVYITKSGSKYHTATCRWVSDSCIEISHKDAVARGYTPCGTCNPRS